jgi:protocatechuate 3,4-dioxygenase beta subunit
MPNTPLDRRNFLRNALALSAATLALPEIAKGMADCEPSTSDIQGPFYRANAPERTVLIADDEPGERLLLRGLVLANDCTTPVPNVIVDLWAANAAGCYSGFEGCAPERGNMNLRGRTITNASGSYEFMTVFPGKYLNGAQFRPAHLHVKVRSQGMSELTTQLYFAGDEHISIDPWASTDEAKERILNTVVVDEIRYARWEIILPIDPLTLNASSADRLSFGLIGADPNPASERITLAYSVDESALVALTIFDSSGRIVRRLEESVHSPGRFIDTWDLTDDNGRKVPNGVYLCVMNSAEQSSTMKLVVR